MFNNKKYFANLDKENHSVLRAILANKRFKQPFLLEVLTEAYYDNIVAVDAFLYPDWDF